MSGWLLWMAAAGAQGIDALPSLVGPGQDQGCTVARPAGDVDGDGLGDLIVGCPYDDSAGHEAGAAYLILDVAGLEPYTPIVDVGIAYTGEEEQDHAGWAVAAIGDFDGDGTDDVAVSAPEASTDLPVVGKVYLLLGARYTGGGLGGSESVRGGTEWGRIGERLFGPQDLDGDGFGDLLVGAPYATPGGGVAAGWLAVVHGGPNAPAAKVLSIDVQPGGSTTTADAAWVKESGESFFGRAAMTMPDQTGDGLPELLIGAPGLTQVVGAEGGDHTPGDHPAGTVFVFASRAPEDVLATPVVSADDAMGTIGGDVAGDALPWVMVAGPAASAAFGVPQVADNAGLVALVSALAGTDLLADRATLQLSGDDPGALLGWALAGSRGQLVADNGLWISEPGWDAGAGRLLAVSPGSGDATAASRAVAVLPGCWPGAQLGFDLGRGTLTPTGAPGDWYSVTAPLASISAQRDGLVLVMDAESMPAALSGACAWDADTGDAGRTDLDGDGHDATVDCDDSAAWRHPGAAEVCGDGVDDDCDGAVDEVCGDALDETGCGCGGGPPTLLPALMALGLIGARRRRPHPHDAAGSSLAVTPTLPTRWQGALPLLLLALPGSARATDADDLATAWIWGSATSEFLQGPVLSGDFDGDGAPDLAIANPRGAALYFAAGEVHLLPASQATGEVDLLAAPVQLMGAEEHDYFGVSAAAVPGTPDGLWVGADRTGLTNRTPGQAMLFKTPMAEPGLRDPTEADLVLSGDSDWDAFGRTMAVGDFDSDGLPDVAIGAPQRDGATTESPGRVWLLHGEGAQVTGDQRVSSVATAELDGGTPLAFLGWRLLVPGDLDGDGVDDLVVGSLGQNPSMAGHLGVFTDLDPLNGIDGAAAGTWAGVAAGDEAGHGLDSWDWDGDGVDEVLVGGPFHAQARGRVWLLDGAPQGVETFDDAAIVVLDGEVGDELGASVAAGPLLLLGLPGADGAIGVTNDGREQLTLSGLSGFGSGLHWIDDLDEDGVPEAVVLAPNADGRHVDQGLALILDGNRVLDTVGSETIDLDQDGVASDLDCDDGDPRRSPDEPEICRNDLDDDCDATVDEQSCTRGGCSTAGSGGGSAWLALVGLGAMTLRRRGGLLALAALAGCKSPGELTLEVDAGPVGGEVPVTLSGDADLLVLSVDGEPVASAAASPLTWTWNTTTVADGDHVLRGVGYRGDADPSEDWATVTVDQSLADEQLPKVSFRSPLDGDLYPRNSDVFISLLVTDDVCVDDVRVYRYGDTSHTHGLDDLLAILPPEGPWELYWESAVEGSWELEAHVLDCVGHSAVASIAFEVSATSPVSCTVAAPSDGDTVSGAVDVQVAASSGAGITSVSVSADGEDLGTDTQSPWGVTWEAGTDERTVTLEATCSAADGATAADVVTVEVAESVASDFEATITRPSDGDPVADEVIFKAAVGGGNGPASVSFYADGALIEEDTAAPWETTWDSTDVADGDVVLSVVGVEADTLFEATDSIAVTVINGG